MTNYHEHLLAELASYLNLPPGWAGENSVPPTAQDIKNAEDFLNRIPAPTLACFDVSVAGDGDVCFSIDRENFTLEVGFNRGEISYYGKTPMTKVKGDFPVDPEVLPDLLEAFIKEFAKNLEQENTRQ